MKKKRRNKEENDEMSKIKEVILVHGCHENYRIIDRESFSQMCITVKRQK
jgi:hypothetical protein